MTTLLLSHFIDVNEVYRDFNTFISTNGIAAAAAGIIVGLSTTTFLRAATEDVLIPLIDFMVLGSFRLIFPKISKSVGRATFKLEHFAVEALVWVVMLVAAFVVMRFLFLRSAPTAIKDKNP